MMEEWRDVTLNSRSHCVLAPEVRTVHIMPF